MERVLRGHEESITYDEAFSMAENAMTEVLFYITGMIDDLTKDEEERADAKINMATMIGKIRNGYFLAGLLADPETYLENAFPEGSFAEIVDTESKDE